MEDDGRLIYILQALDDLHGLGEVALVGDLDHVPPDPLVVLGEHRGHVLHGRRTGGHWLVKTVQTVVTHNVGVSYKMEII